MPRWAAAVRRQVAEQAAQTRRRVAQAAAEAFAAAGWAGTTIAGIARAAG
jgi:AcrR family transcriptional regulator